MKVILTETTKKPSSKEKNFEASYNNYEGISSIIHNKNIKSLSNYNQKSSFVTEENKEKTEKTEESVNYIGQNMKYQLQKEKQSSNNNTNTISSVDNTNKNNSASSSIVKKRAESSMISINKTTKNNNKEKKDLKTSSSKQKITTNLIAGYQKLVANNNEYFKKYNSEQVTSTKDKEQSIIDSGIVNNNKKTVNTRKSTEDKEKTDGSICLIVEKKALIKNQISNITTNFKQIFGNSKMANSQKSNNQSQTNVNTQIKSSPYSKLSTPKPEGDKQLNNEISKKSIIQSQVGGMKTKKPQIIQTLTSSTGIKVNNTSNFTVEVKYGNSNQSSKKKNLGNYLINSRPDSRISNKDGVYNKKVPQTAGVSPKNVTNKILFNSNTNMKSNEKEDELMKGNKSNLNLNQIRPSSSMINKNVLLSKYSHVSTKVEEINLEGIGKEGIEGYEVKENKEKNVFLKESEVLSEYIRNCKF